MAARQAVSLDRRVGPHGEAMAASDLDPRVTSV